MRAESSLLEAPLEEDEGFSLREFDLAEQIRRGVRVPELLEPPYLPPRCVVWVVGPAACGKSMWAAWTASKASRRGLEVAYFSEENPDFVEVDRFRRLRPDLGHLHLFHRSMLDLSDSAHFVETALRCQGMALVVFDTLTALWSGDESLNRDIADLHQQRLHKLVELTGATVVMLHHTGHPQASVRRTGVNAGRGASSIGQKADVLLVFKRSSGPGEFEIAEAKNRAKGKEDPPRLFRIVDVDADTLDIEDAGEAKAGRMDECAVRALEVIDERGTISTNALKDELEGFGGATIRAALTYLETDPASGVEAVRDRIMAKDGKSRMAKVWRRVEQGSNQGSGANEGRRGVEPGLIKEGYEGALL